MVKTSNELTKLLEEYFTPAEILANKQMGIISTNLEMLRHDKNMTQAQFADFLGVSQPMVARWESGEYNFTVRVLAQICAKLNITMEKLFCQPAKALPFHRLTTLFSCSLSSLVETDISGIPFDPALEGGNCA